MMWILLVKTCYDHHCIADDATIYRTGTYLVDIFTHINTSLVVINDWFRPNKLSVNSSTIKTIFYCTNGK